MSLVITAASYGAGHPRVDVTAKAQALVRHEGGHANLHIPGDFNGFAGSDPAPGVAKHLSIDYLKNGVAGHSVFNEGQPCDLRCDAPPASEFITHVSYGRGDQQADLTAKAKAACVQEGGQAIFRLPNVSNDFCGSDPAPGVAKKLTVHYVDKGQHKTVSFNEGQAVDVRGTAAYSGPFVLRAAYGVRGRAVDATKPVHDRIVYEGGQAVFRCDGNYNNLINYDPAPGEIKHMVIVYMDGDAPKKVVYEERHPCELRSNHAPAFITAAHYGSAASEVDCLAQAMRSLRLDGKVGHLALDGNFNGWLGRDPAPGQPKVLELHYVQEGHPRVERFREGQRVDLHIKP